MQIDNLYLLKGGILLQYRLNVAGRTTKDVDGMVRGDTGKFMSKLDEVLKEPWGPLQLKRTEVSYFDVPGKLGKLHRFSIIIELRGKHWRKINFEVSPDEAGVRTNLKY